MVYLGTNSFELIVVALSLLSQLACTHLLIHSNSSITAVHSMLRVLFQHATFCYFIQIWIPQRHAYDSNVFQLSFGYDSAIR